MNGIFMLVNASTGKVLDAEGAADADGTGIIQYASNGGWNQKWWIEEVEGTDAVVIINGMDGGRALDLDTEGGDADGAGIQLWERHEEANQQWKLVLQDDGSHRIQSAATGKVLDIDGEEDGAAVVQWEALDWNEAPGQFWFVIKVDATED